MFIGGGCGYSLSVSDDVFSSSCFSLCPKITDILGDKL